METIRRAALPMRVPLLLNAVLVTYLVATALTEGGGWHDGWRDVWAVVAVLWLVLLVAWVAQRRRRGLPV